MDGETVLIVVGTVLAVNTPVYLLIMRIQWRLAEVAAKMDVLVEWMKNCREVKR